VYGIDNPINNFAWNRLVFVSANGTALLHKRKKLIVIDIKLFDRGELFFVQTFHLYGTIGAESNTVAAFHTKADSFRGNHCYLFVIIVNCLWDMTGADMAANTASVT
jgi:3-keto-L-gulonate-6-phosphate decarboxylase